MPLRLHEPAHHPIAGEQVTGIFVGDKGRDDGVVGAFAGSEGVRVVSVQAEAVAAVL